MYACNFSVKVQVSVVYPLLDTARHGNHIGILFNENIMNNFKNENYFNSYRLKEQLRNYNTGMLSMNSISTVFGIHEIDSHTMISGPSVI